ncbi:MAG: trypsin-like serine protease [Deltaproteobacteria bacterium]|nr:trypsin-like serine protease [Deltaproteobacteria bacterium]
MLTADDVLTAAHCIVPGTSAAAIFYGDAESALREFASVIRVHPNYQPFGSSGGQNAALNDVAIIQLQAAVPLPTVAILGSENPSGGEEIAIFGYGTDENGSFTFEDLRSGEMLISDVNATHVFAKFDGEGSNTCQGDSGGPAMVRRDGDAVIAGVTSSGVREDCLAGDISLFVNVAGDEVSSFIRQAVPDVSVR